MMPAFMEPGQLREDEYVDKGLIHCRTCRTPRQKRIEVNGIRFEPRCMCACQTAAHDRREAQRRQMEFLDTVSKNRSLGLPDPELRRHTFGHDQGHNPEQMARARRYVENWESLRSRAMGMLLWGDVGTGKSFIAGCIANALLDRGVPVLMTNFARILNRLTDFSAGDRNAYIDDLNRFQLLIIDDLGVERNSEFAREQVFSVIDSRYRSQLPMIVTTNLTLTELRNPPDLARARIYDRVLERCVPIRVNGQNVRKRMAAENMDAARKLLGGEVKI